MDNWEWMYKSDSTPTKEVVSTPVAPSDFSWMYSDAPEAPVVQPQPPATTAQEKETDLFNTLGGVWNDLGGLFMEGVVQPFRDSFAPNLYFSNSRQYVYPRQVKKPVKEAPKNEVFSSWSGEFDPFIRAQEDVDVKRQLAPLAEENIGLDTGYELGTGLLGGAIAGGIGLTTKNPLPAKLAFSTITSTARHGRISWVAGDIKDYLAEARDRGLIDKKSYEYLANKTNEVELKSHTSPETLAADAFDFIIPFADKFPVVKDYVNYYKTSQAYNQAGWIFSNAPGAKEDLKRVVTNELLPQYQALAQKAASGTMTFNTAKEQGIALTKEYFGNILPAVPDEADIPMAIARNMKIDDVEGWGSFVTNKMGPIYSALKDGRPVPNMADDTVKKLYRFNDVWNAKDGAILKNYNLIKSFFTDKRIETGDGIGDRLKQLQYGFGSKWDILTDLQQAVYKAYGRELPEDSMELGKRFELIGGLGGQIEKDLRDFDIAFTKQLTPEMRDSLDVYLGSLRIIDRLKDNPVRKKVGNISIEQAEQAIAGVKVKLGEEQFSLLQNLTENNFKQQMDKVLDFQVMAGKVSPEMADKLKQTNKFYVKFDVVSAIDKAHQTVGRRISTTKQLTKAIVGIHGDKFKIRSIIPATEDLIASNRALGEYNLLMNDLGSLASADPKGQFVLKLVDADKVKARMAALIELREKYGEQRAALGFNDFIKKTQKGLADRINKLSLKEPSARVKRLQSIIKSTSEELDNLMEEAQTMASDSKPQSAINSILSKAEYREDRLMNDIAFLNTQVEAFEKSRGSALTASLKDFNMVSKAMDALEETISKRSEDIKALRGIVRANQDLTSKVLPKGYESVSYFRNGIKETIGVPKGVADTLATLSPAQKGLVYDVLKSAGTPAKLGYTALSIAFTPINAVADLGRMAVMSKAGVKGIKDVPLFLLDYARGFLDSFTGNLGKSNKLYDAFLLHRAANSSYLKGNLPEWFGKRVSGIASKALDMASFPSKVIEEAPKLASFRRLTRGMPEEVTGDSFNKAMMKISSEVRNFGGSPDFAVHGRISDELNTLFMFFNARLRGIMSDTTRLAGSDGAEAQKASLIRMGTMVMLPATSLAILNRTPAVSPYYNLLSKSDRMSNFHIPTFTYYTTKDGTVMMNFVRLPKRDVFQVAGNLVEDAVDFAYNKDPKKFSEYAYRFLQGWSPISFEGETGQERAESVVSSANPLLKFGYTLASGRNAGLHTDIVPVDYKMQGVPASQQYDVNTPELYVKLGELLNTSPMVIRQAGKDLFGNVFEQFIGKEKPKSTRPQILNVPPVSRFVNPETPYIEKRPEIATQQRLQGEDYAKNKRAAIGFATRILNGDATGKEAVDFITKYPDATKMMANYIEKVSTPGILQGFDKLSKERKALALTQIISSMAPEEAKKFILELKSKNIL